MLPLDYPQLEEKLFDCDLENWSVYDRIEAMAYSSNTLSGILALLESDDRFRTNYEIFQKIGLNCFGYMDKKDWGDMAGYYGAIAETLKHLTNFSLIERSLGKTFYRGYIPVPEGRMVNFYKKSPRSWVFGDPIAVRCMLTCYRSHKSPISIFTNAAKKGRTRPITTTVKMLSLLEQLGELPEKDVIAYTFWKPRNRKELNTLKTRVNKNLFRLDAEDLIGLEEIERTYKYNKKMNLKPEQVSPRITSEGWRKTKTTEKITRLFYENQDEEVWATDVYEKTGIHLSDAVMTLKYLWRIGFCTYKGEPGIKTKIRLTELGKRVAEEVAVPIMRAAQEGFSWMHFKPFSSEKEYENFWGDSKTIDSDYVLGEFREPMERISDENFYVNCCKYLMEIDRSQNPWRK